MELDRKKELVINAVMNRFSTTPYRVREKASDKALEALAEGKTVIESVQVAQEFIEQCQ